MAKCKCGENWFWDWEQDCYKYLDGSEVESINHSYKGNDEHADVIIFRCKCGAINSSMFTDDRTGSSVCNIKEWENIDWEQTKNSWNDCLLICEDKSCLEKQMR